MSFLTYAYTDNSHDPYETYNRGAFAFNRVTDKILIRPVATVYKTVLPNVAQKGIHNAFSNLDSAPVIINDVLQFKVYQFAQDSWRLFFNTTFGVLGLFDVASKIGLPSHDNDFGMTLAQWGYKDSNYFILPFLGPSTVRDTIGMGMDYQVLSIYTYIHDKKVRYSLVGTDYIQRRADGLQYQDLIDQASVDPYVFQRDAYLQRRMHVIANNESKGSAHEQDVDDDPFVEA